MSVNGHGLHRVSRKSHSQHSSCSERDLDRSLVVAEALGFVDKDVEVDVKADGVDVVSAAVRPARPGALDGGRGADIISCNLASCAAVAVAASLSVAVDCGSAVDRPEDEQSTSSPPALAAAAVAALCALSLCVGCCISG